MMLSGNGNTTNDVPDYLKAKDQLTPFERLLPVIIAAALSFLLVRK